MNTILEQASFHTNESNIVLLINGSTEVRHVSYKDLGLAGIGARDLLYSVLRVSDGLTLPTIILQITCHKHITVENCTVQTLLAVPDILPSQLEILSMGKTYLETLLAGLKRQCCQN